MSLVDKIKKKQKKDRVASPLLHLTIWFFIFSFVSALVLSFILKVEVVSRGMGKIVPLSRVQVVQPEFSGRIHKIYVKNGDLVAKGALLIEFDKTDVQTEINKAQEEVSRLKIERYRLESMGNLLKKHNYANEKSVSKYLSHFHSATKKFKNTKNTNYLKEQKMLLEAEVIEIKNSANRVNAQINSNKQSEKVIYAEIARSKAALKLEKERFIISKKLLNKRTISRASHLDALSAYTSLQKEQGIFKQRLEQIKSNERTLYAEKQSLISSRASLYLQRRNEIESRLSVLSEDMVLLKRRLSGLKLLAPVGGFVDQLKVFTVGGITIAAQELMRIVPNDQLSEIEAIFTNSDVGFIEKGQPVNIKLDAFPAERFGMLKGTVTNVSADAMEVPDVGWGFVVRIKPDTPYLETKVAKYQLRSGMTSTVDIITGERNLISYFFAPLLKTIQDSMGER